MDAPDNSGPYLSVVFPCLDEIQAVRQCIEDASKVITELGVTGEVILCNNGSSDGSDRAAKEMGAIVIDEPSIGYGTACRSGLKAAQGEILVLLDCDGSYHLSDVSRLIKPIQLGNADVVLGSRFLGEMLAGSMPLLNRRLGNPLLTKAAEYVSKVRTTDGQSGMKALSRHAYEELRFSSSGPEFTHEFLVQIGGQGARTVEVSVRYYPRIGRTKLKRWRAALRHLRFLAGTIFSRL